MRLTTEILQRFVGGQIEVQNHREEYLYRGEIATIEVDGETLTATLKWMAQGEGFPALPSRWVVHDELEYSATLTLYSVAEIGPGSSGGGNRISLQSPITSELVVLYPPDGSKLDPSLVEGLDLT